MFPTFVGRSIYRFWMIDDTAEALVWRVNTHSPSTVDRCQTTRVIAVTGAIADSFLIRFGLVRLSCNGINGTQVTKSGIVSIPGPLRDVTYHIVYTEWIRRMRA